MHFFIRNNFRNLSIKALYCIYIHYHGTLRHNELYEPVDKYEWDYHGYGAYMKNIVRGIEKYSPEIDTEKLKAAINLNYDHYNQREELIEFNFEEIVARPFPEIVTPHYVDKHTKEVAKYVACQGEIILSEFIKLESAKKYLEIYASRINDRKILNIIQGSDEDDFLYAYDTSYNYDNWLFLKAINE